MKKFRTPKKYRAPLKTRMQIEEWLTNTGTTRGGREYPLGETWVFCFNVKAYQVDLGFDHLLEVYREMGYAETKHDKPEYLKRCREKFAQLAEGDLWQWAQESAWRDFSGRAVAGCRHGEKPDDDGQNQLADGTAVEVRFSSGGRSSGWLILTEFNGLVLTNDVLWAEVDFETLKLLYRYLVQLEADLTSWPASKRLEYGAAYALFANYCGDVPDHEIEDQPYRDAAILHFEGALRLKGVKIKHDGAVERATIRGPERTYVGAWVEARVWTPARKAKACS